MNKKVKEEMTEVKESNELLALAGMDNSLLALAEEYGVDLAEGDADFDAFGKKEYLNFTLIPEGRYVASKTWQSSGQFTWNTPGNKDIEDFCFNNFKGVEVVSGVIVSIQLKHGQNEYVDEDGKSKVKSHCSLLGYVDPVSGKLLKKLPDMSIYPSFPYKDLKLWDRNTRQVLKEPARVVEALGFVGNEGRSCADCIRAGKDVFTKTPSKPNEAPSQGYCGISAQAVMYVTHVSRSQVVKGKDGSIGKQLITKSVEELYAAEDIPGVKGVLVSINIPIALGIRDAWDAQAKQTLARGLFGYQLHLNDTFKRADQRPFRMMMFHRTNLSAVKAGDKYHLHFEKDSVPLSADDYGAAIAAWKAVAPQEEPKVLNPSDFKTPLPDNVVPIRSADPDTFTTVDVASSELSPF